MRKKGGLTVASFDRSRFKLFSRKFSKKFVLTPSGERPKTAPQTLFLSFESNRRLMKKTGKLACDVVNSNIATGSLLKLQISLGIVALFEQIYYEVAILSVFSNIGEDVQYLCVN
jgi:hypothetical protein